jgi:alkanesulfonate monooxygenase SsuD/methylene tetrahydromethanopterin reductase-like flavin-dependent oxidoreductase (luciferase family)
MKVDTILAADEWSSLPDEARRLEEAGYDAAWTAEVSHDPFLPLAVVAGATSRISLGTSIAVAFARSPMTTAYTANDLRAASGGRFMLGLGSQIKAHVTRRFSMPWGRPAPQMREYILALRAIWASWNEGRPLDVRGEYYQHTLMTAVFRPAPNPYGPPRVFLAAVGAAMTHGSTPAYRPVLALHGWGELADQLHALSVTSDEGRWAAMGELINDEVLHTFAVIGRPQDAGAELKRRYGDVVDRITVPSGVGLPADRVRDLIAALR